MILQLHKHKLGELNTENENRLYFYTPKQEKTIFSRKSYSYSKVANILQSFSKDAKSKNYKVSIKNFVQFVLLYNLKSKMKSLELKAMTLISLVAQLEK